MPTYEYLCTSCGHEWEFEQSIKDEPQKICQKCNKETARRQISKGVGFILKGSGWYADLYSSSSNKEPAKETPKTEGASAPATSEGASVSKSEIKSEGKSEGSGAVKKASESSASSSSSTPSPGSSTAA